MKPKLECWFARRSFWFWIIELWKIIESHFFTKIKKNFRELSKASCFSHVPNKSEKASRCKIKRTWVIFWLSSLNFNIHCQSKDIWKMNQVDRAAVHPVVVLLVQIHTNLYKLKQLSNKFVQKVHPREVLKPLIVFPFFHTNQINLRNAIMTSIVVFDCHEIRL